MSSEGKSGGDPSTKGELHHALERDNAILSVQQKTKKGNTAPL